MYHLHTLIHMSYDTIFRILWSQKTPIWNSCKIKWCNFSSLLCLFLEKKTLIEDSFLQKSPLLVKCNCNFFCTRPCDLLSWVSVRRPSVSFSHLNPLLWNRWTDFNQTCQKCSLDGPLPDLCFWCWFEIQHGWQGP